MKTPVLITVLLLHFTSIAQSDFDKLVRGSEILLSGLAIFKVARSEDKKKSSKNIESLCVKNKLAHKITFRITGLDQEQNEIKKELVVQKDGRECLFEFPKGTYAYEVLLSTNEVYRKGEYRFEDETIFTVKDP